MRTSILTSLGAFCALAGACTIERVRSTDSVNVSSMAAISARLGAQRCGLDDRSVMTGDGIGELRIGRRVAAVVTRCRLLSRSATDANGAETLRIDLFRDTATVYVVRDSIVRLELHHSPFRTVDSIGVGRHLTRVLTLPAVSGLTLDERLYAVTPAHCGIMFELLDPAPSPPAARWGLAALNRLPGETTISGVAIIGCEAWTRVVEDAATRELSGRRGGR